MQNVLFYVPVFYYEVKDWSRKKSQFLSLIERNSFNYCDGTNFQTDRSSSEQNWYLPHFVDIFQDELHQFKDERNLEWVGIKNIWTIKYTKQNESHCPHNHASTGFTGILYLEYDPEVHEPTKFIGPWNNPVTDTTQLSSLPNPQEGVMYIWPSSLLHYTDGMKTDKLRMITSWDMEVK